MMKIEECVCLGDVLYNEAYCNMDDPVYGFGCTRPVGHSGEHVACGSSDHRIAVWPQKEMRDGVVVKLR